MQGSIDCGCLTNGNWCGAFYMLVANDIFDSDTGIKLVPKGLTSLLFTFGNGVSGGQSFSCQCAWENNFCVWFGFPFGFLSGGSAKVATPTQPYTAVVMMMNDDGSATIQIGLAGPIIDGFQYLDGYGAPTYGQPQAYGDGSGQYFGNWTCTFQESLSFDIEDFDCNCRNMTIPDAGISLLLIRS
jgi:hypothetical protein